MTQRWESWNPGRSEPQLPGLGAKNQTIWDSYLRALSGSLLPERVLETVAGGGRWRQVAAGGGRWRWLELLGPRSVLFAWQNVGKLGSWFLGARGLHAVKREHDFVLAAEAV